MNKDKKHLYYLDDLKDYKVKSDDPDVRGWDVKDRDNRVIGKVDDFLVHKDREQVVYVDIEVDESIIEEDHDPYAPSGNSEIHEFVNKEGENHLIIPIGMIDIDEDRKFVRTNQLDYQTFAGTKRVQKGTTINRDYEMAVLGSYNRGHKPGDPKGNEIHQGMESSRHESDQRDSRSTGHDRDFITRPDDTYKEDFRSEETIKREKEMDKAWEDRNRVEYDALRERHFKEQRVFKETRSDEGSFYNRSEFDRGDSRKGRNG